MSAHIEDNLTSKQTEGTRWNDQREHLPSRLFLKYVCAPEADATRPQHDPDCREPPALSQSAGLALGHLQRILAEPQPFPNAAYLKPGDPGMKTQYFPAIT